MATPRRIIAVEAEEGILTISDLRTFLTECDAVQLPDSTPIRATTAPPLPFLSAQYGALQGLMTAPPKV
jgi:hypothetical protein